MTPWKPHDYAWEELHAFIERGFTPPEERPLPKPEPQPLRGYRHSSVIFDDACYRGGSPSYPYGAYGLYAASLTGRTPCDRPNFDIVEAKYSKKTLIAPEWEGAPPEDLLKRMRELYDGGFRDSAFAAQYANIWIDNPKIAEAARERQEADAVRLVEGWLGPRDGLDEKLLFGWIAELQRKETQDGLG